MLAQLMDSNWFPLIYLLILICMVLVGIALSKKLRVAESVAGAWGLFPNKDATYNNYNGANLSGHKCNEATNKIPDVGAFWSITVYGKDGYMKSDISVVNRSNVKLNKDGKTFTVYFGAADKCPLDAKNRLDITDGWNFLMRCYLPGKEITDGAYILPAVQEVN